MNDFTNSWAYVIGIDDYQNGIPPLRTAVNDAQQIASILKEDHGYRVRLFPDDGVEATFDQLERLLKETFPAQVGEQDRVLFYFAGHGKALDGDDGPMGVLVPQDASFNKDSFLPMTVVHDALVELPCRHMLLILDCCFSGSFRWSTTRDLSVLPDVVHQERFARYTQDRAWQVISSAAADQKAWDFDPEKRNNSLFAAALLRGLRGEADLIPRDRDGRPGGDGVITASELHLFLREEVERQSIEGGMRQTPGLWPLKKHDKGEFIFLAPGRELDLPGRCGNAQRRFTTAWGKYVPDAPTAETYSPLQRTMQRIMLRVVSVEGGELARRRVPTAELDYRAKGENKRVKAVLKMLIEARLVVRDKEADCEAYVEPAHDALVRGWDKLLEWTQNG